MFCLKLSVCGSQVHSASALASAHTLPDSLCLALKPTSLVRSLYIIYFRRLYSNIRHLSIANIAGKLANQAEREYNNRQMVKGYLLIKLVPGLESDALSQIRAIPGIIDLNLVFGQWDAIAIAETKSLFELAKVIVGEVRSIQGVQDTTTLLQGEL